MSKGMLGNISLSDLQGPMNDLQIKLASEEGQIWLRELRLFLSKKPCWTNSQVTQAAEPKLEPIIDSIIRANGSQKPTYSDWVKEVLHPELEGKGPAEYAITQVGLWLHDDQKDGKWMKGQAIYDHLVQNQMLESCLGLADLLAIQTKGIEFFCQHFAGKAVFGWKSVVRGRNGNLHAPCLCDDGGKVVLYWRWLEDGWRDSGPALRFAS